MRGNEAKNGDESDMILRGVVLLLSGADGGADNFLHRIIS